jgi:NAD(P)-dependent dehydrogenase (short-subunit alcohol dehydrogenase family)
MTLTSSQATVIQADAADDKAISDACQQALKEEGRLDVFFANVRIRLSTLL